ncbi:MAG: hypothetical protein N3C12_02545 [Candidatus Binatia bacterium]|nr:hypothetical protein [Candidatus Binatia bacterium]
MVLGWVGLLLPLVSWLYLQAYTDQVLAQNLRRELDAFYVAEAGLHYALAAIQSCASAACATRGPDGISGTADDGSLLRSPHEWMPFGTEGRAFLVRLATVDATTVRIRSNGRGWGGGSAEVEALVRWQGDGSVHVYWNQALDS